MDRATTKNSATPQPSPIPPSLPPISESPHPQFPPIRPPAPPFLHHSTPSPLPTPLTHHVGVGSAAARARNTSPQARCGWTRGPQFRPRPEPAVSKPTGTDERLRSEASGWMTGSVAWCFGVCQSFREAQGTRGRRPCDDVCVAEMRNRGPASARRAAIGTHRKQQPWRSDVQTTHKRRATRSRAPRELARSVAIPRVAPRSSQCCRRARTEAQRLSSPPHHPGR